MNKYRMQAPTPRFDEWEDADAKDYVKGWKQTNADGSICEHSVASRRLRETTDGRARDALEFFMKTYEKHGARAAIHIGLTRNGAGGQGRLFLTEHRICYGVAQSYFHWNMNSAEICIASQHAWNLVSAALLEQEKAEKIGAQASVPEARLAL